MHKRRLSVMGGINAVAIGLSTLGMGVAHAAPPTGTEVAAAVDARPDGEGRVRTVTMELTNARGQTRTRVARSFNRAMEGVESYAIFFTQPAAIADTAFLSVDHDAPSATDLRWLYMPADQRVRAIPASERGDSFMGTDFSYDDMQSNLKLALEDYSFEYVEERRGDDDALRHVIRARPTDAAVRADLGYSEAVAVVNPATWIIDEIAYTDLADRPLKTITVEQVEQIQGIWTALKVRAENHQTGHTTVFTMSDVSYRDDLEPRIFDKDELSFGPPELP